MLFSSAPNPETRSGEAWRKEYGSLGQHPTLLQGIRPEVPFPCHMQQGITSAVNPADGNSLSYPAGSLGALEDGVIDLQNLGEWRSELSMWVFSIHKSHPPSCLLLFCFDSSCSRPQSPESRGHESWVRVWAMFLFPGCAGSGECCALFS